MTFAAGQTSALPDLPSTEREGRAILRDGAAGSVLLAGAGASSEAFRRVPLDDFSVLHFATHAVATQSLAMSFVMLSCQSAPDVLTGEDLSRLDLSGQLVVLSACSTADGPTVGAKGVDSLAYAVLRAGASAVVASRWRVGDAAALETMAPFYQALGRDAAVGEALRQARLQLARNGRPVQDWAAFATIGSSDLRPGIRPGLARRLQNGVSVTAVATAGAVVIAVAVAFVGARMITRRAHRRQLT